MVANISLWALNFGRFTVDFFATTFSTSVVFFFIADQKSDCEGTVPDLEIELAVKEAGHTIISVEADLETVLVEANLGIVLALT